MAHGKPGNPPQCWRFGDVTVDERRRELRVDGRAVAIEAKPFEVLLALLRRAGETATKEELIAEVWPGRVVTDGVLTKAVLKLRVAIGDTAQELVRTVHGYGYRLVAPIQASDSEAEAPAATPIDSGNTVPLRPNWRFVRRLGRGGHGEVWLAEHAKTREPRVFKFAANGTHLAALKREITLSRLLRDSLGERADIARVLDWNLDEPPHFIEAEYAAGGSLEEWFEREPAVPRDTRVEIVARIADALAAAHSVGVLHKDLKPANVLVLGTGADDVAIRLTDFGSGGVTEGAALERLHITRMGLTGAEADSTSGTLCYLAPERLSGQAASMRGDVFALGVLLYQLLIGDFRRPLAPGWERQVDDDLLREDIAAAAEQDPARRLGDAAEFARRLRNLPARRAQRAAAQALAQRAQQLERLRLRLRAIAARHTERSQEQAAALAQARHAQQLGLTRRRWQAVALVVLALGIAASSMFAWRELAARRAAERHLAAQESVLRFLREDLLGKADPFSGDGSDPGVRSLLKAAHERTTRALADQPEVAVAVLNTTSAALAGLGDTAAARTDINAALELARAHLPPTHRAYLEAERGLADVDEVDGQWQAARTRYAQLQPRFEQALGPAHPSTRWVAGQLAWTRFLSGDYASAARELCDAAATNERLLGAEHDLTAHMLAGCGLALCRSGQCAQSLAPTQRSIAIRVRQYGEDSPLLAQTLFALEVAQLGSGDAAAALATVERILAICAAHLPATHPQSLLARHEHAAVLLALARPQEALLDADAAVAGRTRVLGAAHGYVAASRSLRARIYAALDRGSDARAEFDAALAIAEAQGKDSELATRIRGFRDRLAAPR